MCVYITINIVIFPFTQYIVCIPPFNKITYCILKSGKLIFHIYSRYYFSFEQCNYTLGPTTLVFVESTIIQLQLLPAQKSSCIGV